MKTISDHLKSLLISKTWVPVSIAMVFSLAYLSFSTIREMNRVEDSFHNLINLRSSEIMSKLLLDYEESITSELNLICSHTLVDQVRLQYGEDYHEHICVSGSDPIGEVYFEHVLYDVFGKSFATIQVNLCNLLLGHIFNVLLFHIGPIFVGWLFSLFYLGIELRKDIIENIVRPIKKNIDCYDYVENKQSSVCLVEVEEIKKQFANKSTIEKKEASSRAMIGMTQMMVHDVRKPFSLLKSLIAMIVESKSTSETRIILQEGISDIYQSLYSVEGMIRDVLEMGGTHMNISTEEVDPVLLIDNVLFDSFRFIAESSVVIESDFKHKSTISVDRLKVERLLTNLVSNAIEHMNHQGRLWFHSIEHEKMIEFCIGNSGSYIPDENREQVFDMFFTEGKKDGTGLGLAIAKKIVEAHSGKIWCNSIEGFGTEFIFTLPKSSPIQESNGSIILKSSSEYFEKGRVRLGIEGQSDLVELDPVNNQENHFSGKILLVEDTTSIAKYWQLLLGDKVRHFSNYDEFCKFVSNENLDDIVAIVSDYYIGNHSTGSDVAKFLSENDIEVPIFLCTGLGSLGEEIDGLFNAVLPKDPQKAVNELRRFLSDPTLTSEKSKFRGVDLEFTRNSKLLIVEDEVIYREHLSRFKGCFLELELASCYNEALSLLSQNEYDYVLSDIHLTDRIDDNSEGYLVMEKARLMNEETVICAMSTDPDPDMSKCMDYFVSKPINTIDELLSALKIAKEKRMEAINARG